MTSRIKRWIDIVDRVNGWAGNVVSLGAVLLVVLVCANVLLRYALDHSILALQDLSWYIFGAMIFLGAAETFRHDRHVRVDVLYSHWPIRRRLWVDLFGIAFLLIPFCILVIAMSLDFVSASWMIGEGSPDPGGLGMRYIPKAFIPAGFLLLLLQAFAELGRRVLMLRGDLPLPDDAHSDDEEELPWPG